MVTEVRLIKPTAVAFIRYVRRRCDRALNSNIYVLHVLWGLCRIKPNEYSVEAYQTGPMEPTADNSTPSASGLETNYV